MAGWFLDLEADAQFYTGWVGSFGSISITRMSLFSMSAVTPLYVVPKHVKDC